MDYRLNKLKNGLKVITSPMTSFESATVTIWARTGTRNEADKVLGISHFLEHMAFKGGKKYNSAKKVSEAIDAIGGEFNASTSKELTKYYVRARVENLNTAFDVLSDMLLSPNLEQKEIDKEKGVIIEEMGMYEDTPMRRVWDRFEQLIFDGHKLGRDIIGKKETVQSIKRSDFVDYMKKYYYTDNMLVTVAGGTNVETVTGLCEKYFGKLAEKGEGVSKNYRLQNKKNKVKLYKKDIQQTHLVVGFPAAPMGDKDRYKDAILSSILSGGMSSRLFIEVREKRGLAYAVRGAFERYLDAGYYAVYAGVDPKNSEKAIKVILDQLYGIIQKRYKVKPTELKKAKEYIKGHLALGLEDTRGINNFLGHEQLMLGKIRTPKEVFAAIDKVSEEDIYRSAKKSFDAKDIKLVVIGPHKSGNLFERLLQ